MTSDIPLWQNVTTNTHVGLCCSKFNPRQGFFLFLYSTFDTFCKQSAFTGILYIHLHLDRISKCSLEKTSYWQKHLLLAAGMDYGGSELSDSSSGYWSVNHSNRSPTPSPPITEPEGSLMSTDEGLNMELEQVLFEEPAPRRRRVSWPLTYVCPSCWELQVGADCFLCYRTWWRWPTGVCGPAVGRFWPPWWGSIRCLTMCVIYGSAAKTTLTKLDGCSGQSTETVYWSS